jgi:hypothetical protein
LTSSGAGLLDVDLVCDYYLVGYMVVALFSYFGLSIDSNVATHGVGTCTESTLTILLVLLATLVESTLVSFTSDFRNGMIASVTFAKA